MRTTFKNRGLHARRHLLACGSALAALAAAGTAQAQNAPDADEPGKDTIIVTGTLIEGIDPVGTAVIGVTAADVEEMGVSNATDLLRRVPQIGDFGALPSPTADASIPFSPIQLRGIGALSGMSTLILLDGKRIVPTSPGTNWVDTQMIPAGIIERVEIIPDGGSSIYGSDAVGGVINFVTRRDFNGFAVDAHYGFGPGAQEMYDATLTGGTSWDSGSVVLSYSYSNRDALLGADLGYLVEDKTALGGSDNSSLNCAPGNVTIGSTSYALPTLQAGTANRCSAFDALSYYPEEERHAVFGTLTQDLAPGIEFRLNGFWSRREAAVFDPDNARSSGTITDANPYFDAIGSETEQTVAFSYQGVLGAARANPSVYEAWQVSPSLEIELAQDWSANLSANYGESDSTFITNRINGTAQSNALAATTLTSTLNPYNPASSNSAVLAAIADFIESDFGHQELAEVRLVVDGTLVELPSGPIRLAVGGEYHREVFDRLRASGPAAGLTTDFSINSDRDVTSLFGELYVPVLDNLELSASARYDHYNDVGSTTNPKLGFTYEPVDGVRLRGSWGTSFHAPALADLSAPLGYELFLPFSPLREASSPFFPDFFKPSFLLTGASPGIRPETAETWSVGVEFEPTSGLKASLGYWNIDYSDRIDQNAGFFFGPGYYSDPANAPYFILNPANAQAVIDKFGDFPVFGFPNLDTMFGIFGAPYVVSDQRKQNLGTLKVDGIDFSLDYSTELAGGELNAGINGSYMLNRDRETVPGSGFFETLDLGDFNSPYSAFNASANLGWGTGPLYVSTTVYHRGSAHVGAEDISSFTTVSLFGRYAFNDMLTVNVNVDNLFDTAPPLRPQVQTGRAFIDQGRVIKIGAGLRF